MKYDVKKMTGSIRDELSLLDEELSDEKVKDLIVERVFSGRAAAQCSAAELKRIIDDIFHSLRSDLGLLQPFLEYESVSEIMVNGKDNVFVERNGSLEKTDVAFAETSDLEEVIRRIAAGVHREINELNPIVDARLADGSRVNAVFGNIAIGGPVLTIRKFPEKGFDMEDLTGTGTISAECAAFLERLVKAGYNIFISGGTSSGKTTFLNVLSDFIPGSERVIVIEDSAELQIRNIENMVRMECRSANAEGKGRIEMRQLIRTSLRMRPDRIIVGEVRGGEVMEMINAMNTGHDGSLSTGHGNSVRGMLRRLESMFLEAADFPIDAIRAQILEGVDVIIHLGRMSDGSRKVLEVAELTGLSPEGEFITNTLFRYDPGRGLMATGEKIKNSEKLVLKGYYDGH